MNLIWQLRFIKAWMRLFIWLWGFLSVPWATFTFKYIRITNHYWHKIIKTVWFSTGTGSVCQMKLAEKKDSTNTTFARHIKYIQLNITLIQWKTWFMNDIIQKRMFFKFQWFTITVKIRVSTEGWNSNLCAHILVIKLTFHQWNA